MDIAPNKFPHEAMHTTFEIIVDNDDAVLARQAADAAFAEIDEIEKELSRFVESSDISQINRLKPGVSARVGLSALDCLKAAAKVTAETGGAFDVTIGPLMACWRNPDKSPRQPSDAELAAARERVGMGLLEINEAERTVRVKKEGVQVDLGAIGKGYACDRAAGLLKDWGISSALVSGGGSTVLALGAPRGKEGWPVGAGGVGDEPEPPYTVNLRDRALSGSGTHLQGRHIMDPRTGRPVTGIRAAWSLCPTAAVADALSTAFFVMSPQEVEKYCAAHPDTSAMLALEGVDKKQRLRYGKW